MSRVEGGGGVKKNFLTCFVVKKKMKLIKVILFN